MRVAWARGVDAVTVSSAEGLANLLAMLGEDAVRRWADIPLFVPHARVAGEALRLGLPRAIVAGPGDADMARRAGCAFRRGAVIQVAWTSRRPLQSRPPRRAERRACSRSCWSLLAIVVAALWFDTRGRIDATQEELAKRLRDIESESRDARSLARQAHEGLRDAQAKIGALEAKLAESQNQQLALEALYQELARNRDEWQLAEIEQVLAIAQQQLQLSGNVRAALLALQLAESRLSRADRPQFLPVRRALARDIERLKALPSLDVPGLSLALDRLAASVDALPLAFEERAERAAPAKSAKQGARRARRGIFQALRQRDLARAAPAGRGAQGRGARNRRSCRRRRPGSCART